jgi:hypothetical protein
MKILVCTKLDLEGSIALNKIVSDLNGQDLMVLLSDHFLKTERENREAARFIFYERDLLVEQIFPLVESLPIPDPRPRYLTFNQIAETFRIPVRVVPNINADESERMIRAFAPDVILSVRFDFIFRPNIIRIPRLGILNVHPGELPAYRGVYASFRAMTRGDEKAGCTLHYVDERIDTGPIVGIRYLTIDYQKSLLWHMAHLYPLGIELFTEILPQLENGERPPTYAQNDKESSYYTFPSPEQFRMFEEKGYQLIDYQEYLNFLSGYRTRKA